MATAPTLAPQFTGRARVGEFTIEQLPDGTHQFSGPNSYMVARGDELLDQIVAGEDTIFNMTCHLSPSTEVAVLVRLQTDYAGWRGVQRTMMELGIGGGK